MDEFSYSNSLHFVHYNNNFLIYAKYMYIVAELVQYPFVNEDAVLITNDNTPVTVLDRVNRDPDHLNSWAKKSYMAFNPTKTNYMVISHTDITQPNLNFNGVQLHKVRSYYIPNWDWC